ncbi:MAG: selenium-dependent xanthine dehydrogenase [Oscillospiraceae bacterium]|jgi:selenium-dependent xanthine dehydrogenase|nr:selenium-dependent xanthine dehydrogenase [Oscillospiraceae bacterium]
MLSMIVNNKTVYCDNPNKRLIDFLRLDLNLTSVKEGCSEGACGTCVVLVDGKVTKACLFPIAKVENKNILTVEGLTEREKEVYTHSFAVTGAVQCGFCIPGMIISAKALLDKNNSPTAEEVKKAINSNICRCTGYVKIIDAILLAASIFRKNTPIPKVNITAKLGDDFIRVDAEEKVLGTGLYTDDIIVDGMFFAKALRTKYPRAKVLSINTDKAEKHPDCIKIITAKDIPGSNKCGHIIKDWDALIAIGDTTRYIGDALAITVTNNEENLNEVLSLIDVEYEVLTPITSPAMALAENAPKIHDNGNILSEQKLKRGDADKAIVEAKHVVTHHYSTPFTEHAFMEPECAIAIPDENGGLLLYTGGQSVYDEQREICGLLGLPPEKVRVKSMLVGGGFGGKEDMSVQHHAALASWIVKKPVKIKLSRQESINIHPKRHAMEIDFTTACDENGIITAVKANIISDTGAYASLGGPVLQRACTHAAGPYNFQNVDITGVAVYTNNPPAGAFRGFGVPQSCFAMESNLNLLADMVGISHWEIRYRNAIKQGEVLPNGQITDENTAMVECLLAVKDAYESSKYTGIACGFKNSGLGVGVPDIGRCSITIKENKLHIQTSAACIGQGMATVLIQMVCETLDINPNLVLVEAPDTAITPNSGTTTASRQTLFTGEATVLAAKKVKDKLGTGKSLTDFILNVTDENHDLSFYGEYNPHTDPMGSDKENPISHIAYGYAAQVAELDENGKLIKITAAYDMGTIVNPKSAEGQIEGGIIMGMGYALTEDFPLIDGIPNVKYGTLGITRATVIPKIETIIIKKENKNSSQPAYGAKGVGELATIPTAPAIQGAYYKLDKKLRTKLPMEDTFYDK